MATSVRFFLPHDKICKQKMPFQREIQLHACDLHIYNTTKFVTAILHWKQSTSCNKNDDLSVGNMLLYYVKHNLLRGKCYKTL